MRLIYSMLFLLGFSVLHVVQAGDFFADLVVSETAPKPVALSEKSLELTSREMNVLLTLSILESAPNCEHGPLDVLHVVFNRMNNPLFPGTVDGIAFQSGAFQPFFSLNGRANAATRNQTFRTRDSAALFASRKRKGLSKSMALKQMAEVEKALKDREKMLDSRDFVGGRSFFLGANQSFKPEAGDVRRKKGSNHFKYGIVAADRNRHKPYSAELIEKAPLSVTVK